jgi:uroporphyrin-III C-methyltransferase
LQQSAITGSAEPLVAAAQADERLARYNQPRLERVRRAVAQPTSEGARRRRATDITAADLRLDEVIRQVDELPLLSAPGAPRAPPQWPRRGRRCRLGGGVRRGLAGRRLGRTLAGRARPGVWAEVRALVRVTRIDSPEAMLVAPEQAFFLRENLKLRLLNARLALLSASSTPRSPTCATRRRRWSATSTAARGAWCPATLCARCRRRRAQVVVPRPDATLAAIATAAAGPLSAPAEAAPTAMRSIIWLVLLFVVAVVAATTLGSNDGW